MARLVVCQPNGKYSMWSTICDDFIYTDLTKEEYIDIRAREAFEEKVKELEEQFNYMQEKNPRASWGMIDYNKCLEILKEKEVTQ